jgi:HEAT repeats
MGTGIHESGFEQLDLFSGAGASPPSETEAESIDWAPLDPSRLSDTELIAALPRARQSEASGLAREAARRGLADAVPSLEALCRRFAGFGLDREVTEQVAALSGLASLDGRAAAESVTRLIVSAAVRGPGVRVALEAACALGCRLPPDRVAGFLRDDDPMVREAACRCARGGADVIARLVDLLTDLRPSVTQAAALALGRLGYREGSAVLARMLGTAPTEEVIRALAGIAGDDDWVRLGQTAVRVPELAGVVLEALEESEEPRAMAVAEGVRRRLGTLRATSGTDKAT